MGLQSALSTALTGMTAAQATIDVAGNNIANSQTVGFKESSVNFATQFLQTQSIGAAPSSSSGGTNPRQTGLGVKVAEIAPNFTQGTIEISSNPLDVAIQGDGFLIVQGAQGGEFYTRNGQLKTNENNEVVTATGQRVLGYNAVDGVIVQNLTPLRIPIGETAVAQETENVFVAGTLDPTATVADTPAIITSSALATAEFDLPDSTGFTTSNVQQAPVPDVSGVTTATPVGTGPGAGLQYYRIVFTDPQGNEGEISADIVFNTGPGVQVDFTNLPVPPGIYTGINVYRTIPGGATPYYFVGATAGTTFSDTVDDATLITNPQIVDTAVDQASYSYYVTFSSQTNNPPESRPTNLVGPISINQLTDGRIRIDSIPQPDGAATFPYDRIRIYRNVAGDTSSFYRVAEIPAGQTVYMDVTPDSAIISNPQVDLDGTKIVPGTLLSNVQLRNGQNFDNLFASPPGTVSFSPKKGDRVLEAKTLAITSTTTVQNLLDFINQVSGIDSSIAATTSSNITSNGEIQIVSNNGLENAISISLSSFTYTPTSTGFTQPIAIPFIQTQDPVGEGATTDFVVFDSLGIPLTVRITTAMESQSSNNTVYRWFATSPDNEPIGSASTVIGTGTLTFDSNGDLVPVPGANSTVAIQRSVTASQSPLAFDLDFSQVSGLANTDNFNNSESTLNVTSQDGFPPGVLTSFAITEGGEIRGIFSNGIEEALGQIRMARFTNNGGLQQIGDNLYAEGVNSGAAQEGDPGADGIGSLTAGAVELSNTDIGQSLIDLILASTQYRGGARVISAVQELLDELLALRR